MNDRRPVIAAAHVTRGGRLLSIGSRRLAMVRWALRSYARTPALTTTILLTLSLGLAAAVASFMLANALVLRPLGGIVRAGELVRVATDDGQELHPITPAMREALRELPAFAGVCAVNTSGAIVTTGGTPDAAAGRHGPPFAAGGARVAQDILLQLSGDCFALFGTRAHMGRLLTEEDDRARAPVAVISHDYWQRALDGAPDVLGRTVLIGDTTFTIVGVTEPAFRGISNAFSQAIAVPASTSRRTWSAFQWVEAIARLAPGVSAAQARAQVEAAWPRLQAAADLPPAMPAATRQSFTSRRAFVGPMPAGIENARQPRFRQPLLLTLGLSVLMLAICAANAASLMTARALGRRREEAMRLALGASPADLAWHHLIDALLPALAAALLAVPLAHAIDARLLDMLRASFRGLDLHLASTWDWRVGAFLAAAVALLTAICLLAQRAGSGPLAPTRFHRLAPDRAQDRSLADLLRGSVRTTDGSGAVRGRRGLVTLQIALTLLLVCGAARIVQTLHAHYSIVPDFAVDETLVAAMSPLPALRRETSGSAAAEAAVHAVLLARIEAIPGVRAASLSAWIPLGAPRGSTPVERLPARPGGAAPALTWSVSSRFFEAAGIPLVDGRPFADTGLADDGRDSGAGPHQGTVILSASLARQLFPGERAVGGRVRAGGNARAQNLLVIGVAADAHLGKPQDRAQHVLYFNYAETVANQGEPFLLVRAMHTHPERLARAVAGAIRAEQRALPLWTRTLASQWDVALGRERLLAGSAAAFGLIGLFIAAAGLFGLLMHTVASRRAELALRIAIGAAPRDITRLVLRDIATLLLTGIALGLLLQFASTRTFDSLFAGIAPASPALIGGTLATIALVALAALWLPLRRARTIDPIAALRGD